MSDTFTASNGVVIEMRDDGFTTSTTVGAKMNTALREFFLHERDKELGRWRWRENPDYVVYPKKPSVVEPVPGVRVVHEKTGRSRDVGRESMGACDGTVSRFWQAARAYFAAHPEPRPWHDAKPGEAWVITYGGEDHAVISDGAYFLWEAGSEQAINDSRITAGRRIWPEITP